MSVTSGFFDSYNGDRRYNAEQMSAIFDGIINDGVFMNVGTAFAVNAYSGNAVTVGIGRAWFNSTWIYNSTLLPIYFEDSELVLDRVDALVIEVNRSMSVRSASIKVVKGTAASSPAYPSLTNEGDVHQYPLAYVYRRAGSNLIIQSDIKNMIGTSECPYVTGILETQNIDKIVAQWESEFNMWFESLEDTLDGDVAANLASDILDLYSKFDDLAKDRAVYTDIQDDDSDNILDSSGEKIQGKTSFVNGGTTIINEGDSGEEDPTEYIEQPDPESENIDKPNFVLGAVGKGVWGNTDTSDLAAGALWTGDSEDTYGEKDGYVEASITFDDIGGSMLKFRHTTNPDVGLPSSNEIPVAMANTSAYARFLKCSTSESGFIWDDGRVKFYIMSTNLTNPVITPIYYSNEQTGSYKSAKVWAAEQADYASQAFSANTSSGSNANRFHWPTNRSGEGESAHSIGFDPNEQYADIQCSDQAFCFQHPSGEDWWYFYPNTDGLVNLGRNVGIGHRWRQLYAVNTTVSTSDRNKKENIKLLSEDDRYLNLFYKLKPVSYTLKNLKETDKHDRTHTGFVAQDIEDSMSEVGLTAEDLSALCKDQKFDENEQPVEGEYNYSLRYAELIALNTLAIQSLKAELDAVKAELEQLKAQKGEN